MTRDLVLKERCFVLGFLGAATLERVPIDTDLDARWGVIYLSILRRIFDLVLLARFLPYKRASGQHEASGPGASFGNLLLPVKILDDPKN